MNETQYIVKYETGTSYYYKDKEHTILHRIDGPAIDSVNGKVWYKDGKIHREDGPAIKISDGKEEYWLNGKKVSKYDVGTKCMENIYEKLLSEINDNFDKKVKDLIFGSIKSNPISAKYKERTNVWESDGWLDWF